MAQTPYILNQLTSYIPRDYFEYLVKKYRGNSYVKTFSCWNHLSVMIWAQLTGRRSLRDIETSIRAHSEKAYRLGFGVNVSRSTIAYANAHRDVAIFRSLAQVMMRRCARIKTRDNTLQGLINAFGVNGFFAIDSSTVTLDLKKFGWSVPQEGYGGIKLHTMYDLLRSVPRMCVITGHEERDQTFMEDYVYDKGCVYVFDRLYFKKGGLAAVNSNGAYFMIRMKRNTVFETMESNIVDGRTVLADDIIRFTGRWKSEVYPDKLRRVRYYSVEKNEVLDFLTNNFDMSASSVALTYRYRWQIELFFKWVKQHLRVTAFY